MTPPIRASVNVAAEYDPDREWVLRDAVDWYKNTVRGLDDIGPLTAMELSHINKSWVAISQAIGKQQGINPGSISFFLHEIAMAEIQLLDTANAEAEAAGL